MRLLEDAPSPATFAHRFGGLDHAFQQLYREPRDKARELVHDQIRQQIPEVLPYSDFLVLDQKLTVSVQPAVPIPSGYAAYWPFRPDNRKVIDITLGVLALGSRRVRDPRLRRHATLAGRHAHRCVSAQPRRGPRLFGRCELGLSATVTVKPMETCLWTVYPKLCPCGHDATKRSRWTRSR